ncbi:hypothetical protein P3T18_006825 [Paraburkholderia sp. GAS199]|uniref:hypothetical protein n=1 Tax=Paraburkholderia sp. GAS199 TaxID=3035126 RepID=UPI003D23800D
MKQTYFLLAASVITLGALNSFSSANAATEDEQAHACRGDAMHFCSAEIPNKEKIKACMKQHMDELSPGCRAMFKDGKKGDAKSNSQ